MANQEQLEILKLQREVWNKWRKDNPRAEIDLSKADLRHGFDFIGKDVSRANLAETDLSDVLLFDADLFDADLRQANLTKAELGRANLTAANLAEANLNKSNTEFANFRGANLIDASVIGAYLSSADFSNAKLNGANLSESNLYDANLSSADLQGADLTGTKLGYTILGNVDLSTTRGLRNINHLGRSTIGIDTINNSKGRIPEVFLRGCGLSDLEIEFAKLANPGLDPEQVTDITYKIHQLYLGGGIQYYSCFISYSSKNETLAKKLHNDLQDNGVRCWFAPEDLKIGDQIRPRIDQEIRLRDKLLVILSENSVKSEWVGDEVEAALEEESKSNRLVLFPIRLDDTVLNTRDDWAAKIKRRRHIGDFSNWKDKANYQKAFERLLRDLKATGGVVNGE